MSWFSKRAPQGGGASIVSRKGHLVSHRGPEAQDGQDGAASNAAPPPKEHKSPKASPSPYSNHTAASSQGCSVLPRHHQQAVGGTRSSKYFFSGMGGGSRGGGRGLVMALLRWLLLAFAGCVTALAVLLLFRAAQSALQARGIRGSMGSKPVFDVSNKQLLSFSVCNSMAEQRLALVSGMILAVELGRVVMLPDLLVDGAEGPDRGRTMPFSQAYDVDHFITALAEKGVEVVDPHRAFPKELYTPSYIPEVDDPVEELALKHRTTKHLHVECPLHRLPRVYFTGANSRIMWAVLEALQPSRDLAKQAKAIQKQLERQTHHATYNFLHLPLDGDWLKACAASVNGTSKQHCKGTVDTIDQGLLNFNVPVTEPLYVSADWAKIAPDVSELVQKKLQVFKVLTSKDFTTQLSGEVEVRALLEYQVAQGAHKFVGNALHPFSSLAIVHRRHRDRWASYYNGGHIPLVDKMPLDQLAWVFTYSSDTPDTDYLVRALVRSALQHHTLRPYCIFMGDRKSTIGQWLTAQGVALIAHSLSWADELWAMAEPHAAKNERLSPIFGSKAALVDNYMRLELPMIEVLSQHVYVLFTEQDLFFHKRISLSLFSIPRLPEVVAMAPDSEVPQGVDGSFMLVNLPALRDSYAELKAFILASKDGGLFASQGIGAAGALHAFVQGPSTRAMLPIHFAAKPFQDLDPIAFVVHFKGPKPHHYVDFFRTDRCEPEAYGNACEHGLTRSLCPYVKKWHMLLDESEDEVGLNLWYACLALYAPHLRGLSRHRLAQH